MAERYFAASVGETMPSQVVETGTSSAGEHLEIRITYDAAGMDKRTALLLIETIAQRILQDTWPPA